MILTAIAQTYFCGFSFPLLLCYVGRILFAMRIIGVTFKFKLSMGFEAAAAFCIFVGVIFTKGTIDWASILLHAFFSALTLLFMFIDERFYLYITVDEEDTNTKG